MPPSLALATFSAFFNGHRSTPASIRLSFPHNSHYVEDRPLKQRKDGLVKNYPPKNRHTKAHPPDIFKKIRLEGVIVMLIFEVFRKNLQAQPGFLSQRS